MGTATGVHSFGRDLRFCQLDGIRISETLMPPGLHLADHAHEAGQICFVLEGEYLETTRAGVHRLRPGVLQIHAPGERHSNQFPTDSEVLALLISIDPQRWFRIESRRPITVDGLLADFAVEIRNELRRLDDIGRAALEGWAILSLVQLARRHDNVTTAEPAWSAEAAALIKQRADTPISLSTVASAVGVHRATLAATFRKFRNMSVGESIRQERVRLVTRALLVTKMPLCEIAIQCGFYDQAHMGRVFRNIIGVSPGAYRYRHR
jgi:AraC family transcriptional regulator